MTDRFLTIVKKTVELNLRSTTAVLLLAKEYVRAIDGIVRGSAVSDVEPVPVSDPAPVPILLQGQLGQIATNAFALSNNSAAVLTVTPVIQAEGAAGGARLEPASAAVQPGADAIIHIVVELTEAFEIGTTYSGIIAVPGMAAKAIPFSIRRIAAAAADSAANGAAEANTSARDAA